MKKSFFGAIMVMLMLVAMPSQAQIKLGLRGGVNLSDVKFNKNDLKADNRVGFFAGPVVKLSLPLTGLSVDASALYDQRELKMEDTKLKSKTFVIPVNLRFTAGTQLLSVFAFAGPQFAFNISDDLTLKENYREWKWKDSQFSINVGVGVGLGRHIEVSGNYNIICDRTADSIYENIKEGTARANAWQVGLAYFF